MAAPNQNHGIARLHRQEVSQGTQEWRLTTVARRVGRVHRAWALDHQAEHLLLCGHPGAGPARRRDPRVDQAFAGALAADMIVYAQLNGAIILEVAHAENLIHAAHAACRYS
jgi:hypothetical protein